MFYYAIMAAIHTHAVIHANTSTKNKKIFKNSKNGKKEQNW